MSKTEIQHSCNEQSPGTQSEACAAPLLTATQILAVSLSAGVIAAIVIGAIIVAVLVGLGGKKGYDAYMANKANLNDGQTNPMYNDAGLKGTSPFYTATEMQAKA
jgi:hypothetical protein